MSYFTLSYGLQLLFTIVRHLLYRQTRPPKIIDCFEFAKEDNSKNVLSSLASDEVELFLKDKVLTWSMLVILDS